MQDLLIENDSLGLASLVARREVSAGELLEAAIAQAEALDPRFNFMAQRHYDYARRKIGEGLPQGPFTGVPWLLKDLNTYIAGELTEGGSRFYKGYRAQVTSELVSRIEAAGFVIFGKTTTPEFGQTATTESVLCGATRNPWNPEHIAGGSSGGAAAAVAAGVIPAAHATDGGGSIRIPASCCGLFGLKPSRGRVPNGPLRTEGWGGMSTGHCVSWSVRDSAAVLDATHGQEPGSRYVAPTPARSFLSALDDAPRGLRIAFSVDPYNGAAVDPEVARATREAARLCESLGHHVEEARAPIDFEPIAHHGFTLIAASMAAEIEDRAQALGIEPGPDVLEEMSLATLAFAKGKSGMDFARANNAYQAAAIAVAQFQQSYDIILSPTLSQPPLRLGQINPSPGVDAAAWGKRVGDFVAFTSLYNGTGQPSMSVPLAMSDYGLPIGVMFTSRYGEEELLLRLARQLEIAAPWKGRRPAV